MRKKKIENFGYSLEISRENVIKFLQNTTNEILNEGLPYDKDAEKQFSKEEFDELVNDYRLYGNLFSALFISRIIDKIDNMVISKYMEKEGK